MVWVIRSFIAVTLATLLAVLHYYSPLQMTSVVPYAGLLLAATGLICLAHPMKTIFIRNRWAAAGLIATGFVAAALALWWPNSTTTITERVSLLDEAMPQYEFVERHQIRVHTTLPRAFTALKAVTPDELPAYNILMKVRSAALGRSWTRPKGPSPPIVDVFSDPSSGFKVLHQTDREMVFGGIGRLRFKVGDEPLHWSPETFASMNQPGSVKVAFNLRVTDAGNRWTNITTETRLHALDEESCRGVAIYWRMIYPGSGMLRTMWLQAARSRAEGRP